MKKIRLAICGATGAVGRTMLKVLEERDFPLDDIRLLASSRSAGTYLDFKGEKIKVYELKDDSFSGIDVALFSAGGEVSKVFAPIAAKSGAVVVDNTSAFRMDPDVPLVVPEVNPHDIASYTKKNIIANPNCSTIQMVVVLWPIHKFAKIKRVVVSTYQAVSGSGQKAILEMKEQIMAWASEKPIPEPKVYPKRIAFNCLPHIDVFLENGYTKEEMKMVNETKKIMGDPSILVTATTVRVPVEIGHSESVNIETEKKVSSSLAKEILSKAEGVIVMDEPENNLYPTPIICAGKDEVFVGRIREDTSLENGLNLWIVADNLRKGAATNAVQIAEILVDKYL